jgi:uncharacterized RDD family membrane protein YckC
MACFLYEGFLLLGVIFIAAMVNTLLKKLVQNPAAFLQEAVTVVVLGVYFVWFWSRYGQTLAMKTWRIRLVTQNHQPPSRMRSLGRYIVSYIWVMPAVMLIHLNHYTGWAVSLVFVSGVAGYAALVFLHPGRQFWHDVVCGTRLIRDDTR